MHVDLFYYNKKTLNKSIYFSKYQESVEDKAVSSEYCYHYVTVLWDCIVYFLNTNKIERAKFLPT